MDATYEIWWSLIELGENYLKLHFRDGHYTHRDGYYSIILTALKFSKIKIQG